MHMHVCLHIYTHTHIQCNKEQLGIYLYWRDISVQALQECQAEWEKTEEGGFGVKLPILQSVTST